MFQSTMDRYHCSIFGIREQALNKSAAIRDGMLNVCGEVKEVKELKNRDEKSRERTTIEERY